MKTPMTGKEADEKYLCNQCKKEGHGTCEFDCVLSSTCSFNCTNCEKRVWFQGDLRDTPKTYICPYCKKEQINKWYTRLRTNRDFYSKLKE